MTPKRYVRPTIGGWLRPTLIAPWLSTYATVSLYAMFAPEGWLPRWATWAMLMALGTAFAGAYVLVTVVVDVALLAIRQRVLPAGAPGWKMSLASPVLVLASYLLVKPHTYWRTGPWGVALAIFAPMIVGAIVTRVVAGQRPPA